MSLWDDMDPALNFLLLFFFSVETGESHSFLSPLERVPSLEVGVSWRLVVYSSGSCKTLHLFQSLFCFGPKMFSECSARCSACLCVIYCTAVCMWLSVLLTLPPWSASDLECVCIYDMQGESWACQLQDLLNAVWKWNPPVQRPRGTLLCTWIRVWSIFIGRSLGMKMRRPFLAFTALLKPLLKHHVSRGAHGPLNHRPEHPWLPWGSCQHTNLLMQVGKSCITHW